MKSEGRKLLRTGIKSVIAALVVYSLASHNGHLDSMRTKETSHLQGLVGNKIKTVASVEEYWKDNVTYSLMMDGYNPLVRRNVLFEDGSQTTLRYRTLAWQPLMKWINGNEFNHRQGEQYEVTSSNDIVRKVR